MTKKEFNQLRKVVRWGNTITVNDVRRLVAYTHQRNVRIRQLEQQLSALNKIIDQRDFKHPRFLANV